MEHGTNWTIGTYVAHNEALRDAQTKFEAERDRRLAEVNIEKEKALRIKEEADKAALGLAREIQTYKDEKANELRSQINNERGLYATRADVQAVQDKLEVMIKPLAAYIALDQGRGAGLASGWAYLLGAVAAIASLIAIGSFVFRTAPAPTQPPQVVLVPAPQGTMLPATPPQATPGR
jgi:hypothetical protein